MHTALIGAILLHCISITYEPLNAVRKKVDTTVVCDRFSSCTQRSALRYSIHHSLSQTLERNVRTEKLMVDLHVLNEARFLVQYQPYRGIFICLTQLSFLLSYGMRRPFVKSGSEQVVSQPEFIDS